MTVYCSVYSIGIVVDRTSAVDMTSRSVLREIAAQLEAAAEQDPHFWAGLREEIGRSRMEQGARRHRAVQMESPLLDVVVQVAPATEERAA